MFSYVCPPIFKKFLSYLICRLGKSERKISYENQSEKRKYDILKEKREREHEKVICL
jgi:hypothetical protein